jgi:hypothetical protein
VIPVTGQKRSRSDGIPVHDKSEWVFTIRRNDRSRSPEYALSTRLNEDSGPITSTQQLLVQAACFELSQPQAQSILEEVAAAVNRWRDVATSAEVGLQTQELNDFRPAFERQI